MRANVLVSALFVLMSFNLASAQVNFNRCLLFEYAEGQYVLPYCFEASHASKIDGSGIYMAMPTSDSGNHPTIEPGACLRTTKTEHGVKKTMGFTRFYFRNAAVDFIFTSVNIKGQRTGELLIRNENRPRKFIEMNQVDSDKLRVAFKRFYAYDLKLMCLENFDR